jgi:hypothetical protein
MKLCKDTRGHSPIKLDVARKTMSSGASLGLGVGEFSNFASQLLSLLITLFSTDRRRPDTYNRPYNLARSYKLPNLSRNLISTELFSPATSDIIS